MAGTKHEIIANVPTWVTPGGTYVAVINGSVINNTLFDAKGDIITATADDTPARLAVGADGEVLTADSSTATGLDWVAPLTDHGGLTGLTDDDHTQYQKESEKDAASGYVGLDASENATIDGIINGGDKIRPGTDAGATQTASGIYAGTGAPNNANGADGDFYLRADGGALATIYQRRIGIWVGIL